MVLVGHLLATAGLAFIALTFVFLFGRKADQIEMLDGVVDEQSTSIVELQNRVQQLSDENAWLKHYLEQYIGSANVLNDERQFLCGDLADAYEQLAREENENRQSEHAMNNAIDRLQARARAHEIAIHNDSCDSIPWVIPQTLQVTIGG